MRERRASQLKNVPSLPVYILLFFSLHILRVYLEYDLQVIPQGTLPLALHLLPLMKIVTWTLPALVFIKYFLKQPILTYLKLDSGILHGIAWGLLAAALQLILIELPGDYFFGDRTMHFTLDTKALINAVLLVGFIEEIPFRGIMLQELSKRTLFWKANTLTAFLFMLIHIPGWICMHSPIRMPTLVSIFMLGWVFGWLVRKSDSLWASIIFHSCNNLFSLMIFSL